MSNSNTAVFIDGANFAATTNKLKCKVNFEKLREVLDRRYGVPPIYYYTALYNDPDNDGHCEMQKLADWLSYNGYRLVTKLAKRLNNNGKTVIKGNMDIEMALDAFRMVALHGITRAILFTGDGDFTYLVNELQRMNCFVTVISSSETKPPMCAGELRKQADSFVEITDLIADFAEIKED